MAKQALTVPKAELNTLPIPNSQIKRWYDFDPSVSQLVHLIETLNPVSQKLLSTLIIHLCKQLVQSHNHKFIKNLKWETYQGILKSRRGRRWYDQEREVKIAFNMFFSMTDSDKIYIAKELIGLALIIEGYESHCKTCQNKVKSYMINSIISTYLRGGAEKATQLYGVFLQNC